MSAIERYMKNELNCAQASLCAAMDEYAVKEEDEFVHAFKSLGNGVTKTGTWFEK